MNSNPNIPQLTDEETLSQEWIAALGALRSEQVTPSIATDAAIMNEARASLRAIRRRKKILRMLPALAAAACLAFAFIAISRIEQYASPEQFATVQEDKYAVILREVSAVFPHNINAIVTDGDELQIALSDEPISEGAQAVVIEACIRGNCTTIITYVGQTVEIAQQSITVYADEAGDIMTESRQPSVLGLQIKTRCI